MTATTAALLPRLALNISLAILSVFLQSANEVYSFTRPGDLSEMKSGDGGAYSFLRGGLRSNVPKRHNCVELLSAGQVVRALPPNKVPLKEVYPKGQSSQRMQSSNKNVFSLQSYPSIVLLLSQMSHPH